MKEEIYKKTLEELLDQGKFDAIDELTAQYEKEFWEIEYTNLSRQDKIKYWSNSFHREMRETGESGYDEMSIYTKENYQLWLEKEPEIRDFLPEILSVLRVDLAKV